MWLIFELFFIAKKMFFVLTMLLSGMEGICGLYERKIRNINPMVRNLTYDISDLYNFMDGLTDISALV
jgi:hypothetical protein